jgi:hypothetical protein
VTGDRARNEAATILAALEKGKKSLPGQLTSAEKNASPNGKRLEPGEGGEDDYPNPHRHRQADQGTVKQRG